MKEIIRAFSTLTKCLLVISLGLIAYGYLCRAIGLYFFWESATIGWPLLSAGIISLLRDRIKWKKVIKKNVAPEIFGISIAALLLLIQLILLVAFSLSDAYSAAKLGLINNKDLVAEIGVVEGFGLNTTGSINVTQDSAGEHGNAVIQIVAKGRRKFKDVTVYVVKRSDKPKWEIESIE